MPSRSRFVADLREANQQIEALLPRLGDLGQTITNVSERPLAPAVPAGGPAGVTIPGDNLRNRTAAGAVAGAGPVGVVGGVPNPLGGSFSTGSLAPGGVTRRYGEPAGEVTFDALLAIYVANPQSEASQPVKRIMDWLIYQAGKSFEQAVVEARAAYEQMNKKVGAAGRGGSTTGIRNPAGPAGGALFNLGLGELGFKSQGGKSSMTAGETAIVQQLQQVNKSLAGDGGTGMRAGGLV